MGNSNLKKLQFVVILGFATFVALGFTLVQRGFTEIARIGQNTFRAVGPQAKQTRSVGDFDRVQAGGIYEVDIRFGSTPSVVIEAPKDLLPYLTSDISGGTLNLASNRNFNLSDNAKIKAHIVTRRLRAASISGAGKMVINGKISDGSFDASASGAASLKFSAAVDTFRLDASGAAKTTVSSLRAQHMDIQASGAAECMIDGSVGSSKIEASGSCNIKGQLTSDTAEVQTSGAAHATLRVTNALVGEASGASSINYSGRPTKVTSHTSGVGSINRD
jgi:hypothetical protein